MVQALLLLALVGGSASARQHMVVQDGMILIFDSRERAKELDSRYCYNAVAEPSVLRRLNATIAKGREPRFAAKTIKGFFGGTRAALSPHVIAHPIYQRRSVPDFCERADLIVIKSAE